MRRQAATEQLRRHEEPDDRPDRPQDEDHRRRDRRQEAERLRHGRRVGVEEAGRQRGPARDQVRCVRRSSGRDVTAGLDQQLEIEPKARRGTGGQLQPDRDHPDPGDGPGHHRGHDRTSRQRTRAGRRGGAHRAHPTARQAGGPALPWARPMPRSYHPGGVAPGATLTGDEHRHAAIHPERRRRTGSSTCGGHPARAPHPGGRLARDPRLPDRGLHQRRA